MPIKKNLKTIIVKSSGNALIDNLYQDLSQLIEKSRHHVAKEFNRTLIILYWSIGQRIHQDILAHERAEYGEEVVKTIATELTNHYGKGYSRPNLFRMVKFAKLFPEKEIVSTLSRQLSWSHIVLLTQIEDSNKRNFYLQIAAMDNWSVRNLKKKMDGMLFSVFDRLTA